MERYIKKALTIETLKTFPGFRYEGRLTSVEAIQVFDKFKVTKSEVPELVFADGMSWIPNNTARRALVDCWGPDTNLWLGKRLAVQLITVARPQKGTGRLVERWEKRAEPLEDEALRVVGGGR